MSLETSSPSNFACPFPLLRLPHELLDTIFEYAYDEDKRPKPICRALRVFAQRRFFRDVRCETYEALRSFAELMAASVHLRSMVRTLSVCTHERSNWTQRPCGELKAEVDREVERIVVPSQWALLLDRLHSLLVLTLSNVDTALLEVLVNGTLPPSALQKLRRLQLFSYGYRSTPDGWWPAHLARYRSLQHIELNGPSAIPAHVASPSSIALPNITSLSLTSGELGSYPSQDFAALFPSLQRFALCDSSCGGFGSILSTVPDTIKSLSIRSQRTFRMPNSVLAVDDYLGRFTRLEELHLDQNAFTLARLDPFVRSLTDLRILSFGLSSPVTDDFLLSLVDGCSEAGLIDVVEAAEAAGIEVVGTALDVIGFDDDWQCEIRKALLIWGKQEANFREARDFFGYDFYWEGRRFFGDHEWERLLKEERRWV